MITIGSLVLVVSILIGASVSSVIWLVPFEDVWMEATHACVFVIMLGGLRGSRWVLAKLSLMILPADNVKASYVSTMTEFMWWGWNLVVPYFNNHLSLEMLQRDFTFDLGLLSLGWLLMDSTALSKKDWICFFAFVLGHNFWSDYRVHLRKVSYCWQGRCCI